MKRKVTKVGWTPEDWRMYWDMYTVDGAKVLNEQFIMKREQDCLSKSVKVKITIEEI